MKKLILLNGLFCFISVIDLKAQTADSTQIKKVYTSYSAALKEPPKIYIRCV